MARISDRLHFAMMGSLRFTFQFANLTELGLGGPAQNKIFWFTFPKPKSEIKSLSPGSLKKIDLEWYAQATKPSFHEGSTLFGLNFKSSGPKAQGSFSLPPTFFSAGLGKNYVSGGCFVL